MSAGIDTFICLQEEVPMQVGKPRHPATLKYPAILWSRSIIPAFRRHVVFPAGCSITAPPSLDLAICSTDQS